MPKLMYSLKGGETLGKHKFKDKIDNHIFYILHLTKYRKKKHFPRVFPTNSKKLNFLIPLFFITIIRLFVIKFLFSKKLN